MTPLLLVATLALAGVTEEQTVHPGAALVVGMGGAAGAFAGVIGAGAIVGATPQAEASLGLSAAIFSVGLGSAIGAGAAAALVGTASDVVLASTIAFGASSFCAGLGAWAGVISTIFLGPVAGVLVFATLSIGGAMAGAAWGGIVGVGLPQE